MNCTVLGFVACTCRRIVRDVQLEVMSHSQAHDAVCPRTPIALLNELVFPAVTVDMMSQYPVENVQDLIYNIP